MAVSFGEQIHALSGFDGDSTSASEIGENFDDVTAEWMNNAVREVTSILPKKLKMKCAQSTYLYVGNTNTTFDMDGVGEILFITRENADTGYQVPCREIPAMYGPSASDSTNIMYFASATDPIYYIDGSVSNTSTLRVIPLPTALQPSIVNHITYPVFDADGSGTNINIKTATSIANFPDEAEYLIVLRASITATEYMMLFEEDQEVYGPQLQALRQDYQQGLSFIKGGSIPQEGAK